MQFNPQTGSYVVKIYQPAFLFRASTTKVR